MATYSAEGNDVRRMTPPTGDFVGVRDACGGIEEGPHSVLEIAFPLLLAANAGRVVHARSEKGIRVEILNDVNQRRGFEEGRRPAGPACGVDRLPELGTKRPKE